ncbi:MAG: 2Fe-2S iron-sulfur cluster-binding protein, partial [Acidimicrobiia bacterium]
MTITSESISTVSVRVDGADIEVPEGSTVLDACRQAGADIPTLCYGPTMTAANACRVCV